MCPSFKKIHSYESPVRVIDKMQNGGNYLILQRNSESSICVETDIYIVNL